MKNILPIIIFCAAFVIIGLCASTNYAQQENPPLAGGYSDASKTDAEVIAAAKYAVKTQAKKEHAKIKYIAVTQAEKQVVAGMNYRLCLSVEVVEKGKKKPETKTIQTVVFKNLQQKFSLTDWSENGCGKENNETVN